jgi:hypothetical protein
VSRKQVANLDREELLAELQRIGELSEVNERGRQVVARIIGDVESLPAGAPADGPMTVEARLLKVKDAIGALGKDKQMGQDGGYSYRGIDAILDHAHDALIRWGVVIVPVASDVVYDVRQTRGGNPMTVCLLEVTWGVKGVDGEALEPMPVTRGEATDTSDKATNKAHTAAYKVLLSELFAIPYSEQDPDEERIEQGVSERGPAEPWDVDRLAALTERWENLPADLASKVIDRMRKASNWSGGNEPGDWPASFADLFESTVAKAWEAAESRSEHEGGPSTAAPLGSRGDSGEGETAPALFVDQPDEPGGEPRV